MPTESEIRGLMVAGLTRRQAVAELQRRRIREQQRRDAENSYRVNDGFDSYMLGAGYTMGSSILDSEPCRSSSSSSDSYSSSDSSSSYDSGGSFDSSF